LSPAEDIAMKNRPLSEKIWKAAHEELWSFYTVTTANSKVVEIVIAIRCPRLQDYLTIATERVCKG
jgi:hypothetical protein